jgi:hypothetical protein
MADEAQKPKPARITQVSFGMTVNTGRYENVKFELTALVSDDEDWRDVMDSLNRRSEKLKSRIYDEYGNGTGDA